MPAVARASLPELRVHNVLLSQRTAQEQHAKSVVDSLKKVRHQAGLDIS